MLLSGRTHPPVSDHFLLTSMTKMMDLSLFFFFSQPKSHHIPPFPSPTKHPANDAKNADRSPDPNLEGFDCFHAETVRCDVSWGRKDSREGKEFHQWSREEYHIFILNTCWLEHRTYISCWGPGRKRVLKQNNYTYSRLPRLEHSFWAC